MVTRTFARRITRRLSRLRFVVLRTSYAEKLSMYSLSIPLLANDSNPISSPIPEASTSYQPVQEDPVMLLQKGALKETSGYYRRPKRLECIYLLGHGDIRARKDSWFSKKLIINYFHAFLRKNSRRSTANLSIPHSRLMHAVLVISWFALTICKVDMYKGNSMSAGWRQFHKS